MCVRKSKRHVHHKHMNKSRNPIEGVDKYFNSNRVTLDVGKIVYPDCTIIMPQAHIDQYGLLLNGSKCYYVIKLPKQHTKLAFQLSGMSLFIFFLILITANESQVFRS